MFDRCLSCILCAVLVAAAPLRLACAQDVLKVDVNLVRVFATVQSTRGEAVSGLSVSDFRIFEDDVEQKISVFEKDEAVQSSIGILLDNSGSMVDTLPAMKSGILDFAQKTRRSDELFVMTFGARVRVLQDVDQPVKNLESAFRTMDANGTSVLFDALLEAIAKVERSGHERKALIVFTDGYDNGSKAGFGAVTLAAQRSGVLLYFIPIGARMLIDQPTVNSLAALSGGRVIYLASNDPVRPAMESIRAELSRQYYLGYYVQRSPGAHHIRVEAPGRDLRIRSKTGYMVN